MGNSCEKPGHGQSCLVVRASLHVRIQMEGIWGARGQQTALLRKESVNVGSSLLGGAGFVQLCWSTPISTVSEWILAASWIFVKLQLLNRPFCK